MLDYYFTFRSVTAAQSAARTLERAGVASGVVRTPRSLQKQGCGYSLRIPAGRFQLARELLLRGGVKYQKIYTQNSAGKWEEIQP